MCFEAVQQEAGVSSQEGDMGSVPIVLQLQQHSALITPKPEATEAHHSLSALVLPLCSAESCSQKMSNANRTPVLPSTGQ